MSDVIRQRVAMGKEVREVFEVYSQWTPAHWERLRDELLVRHPIAAPVNQQPMSDNEARNYETTQVLEFGKYLGRAIRTVPLKYLRWLCREQEDFYGGLRRYLKSNRVLTEERLFEEEIEDV